MKTVQLENSLYEKNSCPTGQGNTLLGTSSWKEPCKEGTLQRKLHKPPSESISVHKTIDETVPFAWGENCQETGDVEGVIPPQGT